MPRVLFVNRFYPPDVAATGQLLAELAEDLVARGWEVAVITGRARYDGDASARPGREPRGGVVVERVRSTAFGRDRTGGRLMDQLTFYAAALWRVLTGARPDVVVATTDPPLLHVGCAVVARLRGAAAVAWTQDVYPELALRLGVFARPNLLYRLIDRVARLGHALCDAVVVVGDRMAEMMAGRGVPADRIVEIPNWTDCRAIAPVPPDANSLLEGSSPSAFRVLYSGNAGRAHAFDGIMEAAARLAPDVEFVFVGGGAAVPSLRRDAERVGAANVLFRDYVEREWLAESLSTASVALVTQDPRTRGLIVPSKLYPLLAAGRPVLFVGPLDSEAADVVRSRGCGAAVAPGDVEGMIEAIQRFREDPAALEAAGRRAREAAVSAHDRPVAAGRWDALLRRVCAP